MVDGRGGWAKKVVVERTVVKGHDAVSRKRSQVACFTVIKEDTDKFAGLKGI